MLARLLLAEFGCPSPGSGRVTPSKIVMDVSAVIWDVRMHSPGSSPAASPSPPVGAEASPQWHQSPWEELPHCIVHPGSGQQSWHMGHGEVLHPLMWWSKQMRLAWLHQRVFP